MFFIAYAFNGQVHVFVGRVNQYCKSLVLQDKCNIEIFLSPDVRLPEELRLQQHKVDRRDRETKNLLQ